MQDDWKKTWKLVWLPNVNQYFRGKTCSDFNATFLGAAAAFGAWGWNSVLIFQSESQLQSDYNYIQESLPAN